MSFIGSLICIRAARLSLNQSPDEDAGVTLDSLQSVSHDIMTHCIAIKVSIPESVGALLIKDESERLNTIGRNSGALVEIADAAVMEERLVSIGGATAACIVCVNMLLEVFTSDPNAARYSNYTASYTKSKFENQQNDPHEKAPDNNNSSSMQGQEVHANYSEQDVEKNPVIDRVSDEISEEVSEGDTKCNIPMTTTSTTTPIESETVIDAHPGEDGPIPVISLLPAKQELLVRTRMSFRELPFHLKMLETM